MHVAEVVTVDDRGRVTLDSQCREALCIKGIHSRVRITASVLWPAEKRGRKVQFERDIDPQGRFSIPVDERRELGIDGQGASLDFIIEAIGETDDPPFE